MRLRVFGNAVADDTEDTLRAQARTDAIVAAARASIAEPVKRPIYRAPGAQPLEPSTDAIDLRIEEELALTIRMLEALGDEFAADPILLKRYSTTLQSIDLMSQTLGHLGRIIGAKDKAEAIDRVGMANLKARLMRGRNFGPDGTASFVLHRSDWNALGPAA